MSTEMPCLHPLPAPPVSISPLPMLLPPLRKLAANYQQTHPVPPRLREVRRPDLAARLKKCELNARSGPALRSLPVWLISAPALF